MTDLDLLLTPKATHRQGVLERDSRCGLRHLGGCGGRIQSDHIIEVQAIRRRRQEAGIRRRLQQPPLDGDEAILTTTIDALIASSANGWALCERHHSLKWQLAIDSDWLPFEVDAFAEEYGLRRELARLTGSKAA